MKASQNPHDRLFKSTFSNLQIAKDYITHFLPQKIINRLNLSTLELQTRSYVSEELEEFFTDVIYTCKYKERELDISLLLEHKSDPKGIIYLQLLRYLLEAWDKQEDYSHGLQLIIPIVIYHGKKSWKQRPFESYFEEIDDDFKVFIPQFEYILTDLSEWSDEALLLLEVGLLKNTFLLLKHYREDQYIREYIERLFIDTEHYVDDQVLGRFIDLFLVYVWQTSELSTDDFRKIHKRLPKLLITATMTTYEQILLEGKKQGIVEGKKQGIAEGKKQGIVEGKKQGKQEQENLTISHAYKEGVSIAMITRLTGLTELEIINRLKELGLVE